MFNSFRKKSLILKQVLSEVEQTKSMCKSIAGRIYGGPSRHEVARRQAVYMGENTILTTTDYGCKIYVDSRDISLSPHIVLEGIWETWIAKVFDRNVKPGNCVVDVGCNCGYYTLLACKNVGDKGSVSAIDANPRMIELLNKSISVNGFSKITRTENVFVGEYEAEQEFRIPDQYMGSASRWMTEETAKAFGDTIKRILVKEAPLVNIVGSRPIDVLKVDAEGAEPTIWKGALPVIKISDNIKIFMEWAPGNFNAAGYSPAEFLTELEQEGFQISEINPSSECVPVSRDRLLGCDWLEAFVSRTQVPS